MEITEDTIQFCINILTAQTAARFAEKNNMTPTNALRTFFGTKTYELLLNADSYLYLESMEYVLDMWEAEINNDWERWLEI